MGVSGYWSLNVLCVWLCFCVISNQSTSKNHMRQTSVNSTPCCIKHILSSFCYWGTKVWNAWIHNIIKQINTSNVARSLFQSKKQNNRKISGVGDWRRQRGLENIWKSGVSNIGVFHKIGGLRSLCQLCEYGTLLTIVFGDKFVSNWKSMLYTNS